MVLRTKVQVGVIFDEKYFYRLLSAINSNVVLLSILFIFDIIQCIDNKTFMQSSEVNIFIGSYQQLITTLILLSILLICDTIKHSCRVQRYIL